MADESKPSYYAIIPASVRYDKDITPNAKLLYGEITALCNKEGYCWSRNEYFSNLYGVSKTSISKWIASLIKKGYLKSTVIYKEGTKEIDKRCLIIVKDPIEEKLNTPLTKVKDPIEEKLNTSLTKVNDPIEEKLKDNTTINTTTNITSNKNKPASRFMPPTVEEVTNYCNERKNNIDPEQFVDYYASKGWFVGNTRMKDWKAAVRNWERRNFSNAKSNQKTADQKPKSETDIAFASIFGD